MADDANATSLATLFEQACATTPLALYSPAELDAPMSPERELLVQNASGEIFLSAEAVWRREQHGIDAIRSAMHLALSFCQSSSSSPPPPPIDATIHANLTTNHDATTDSIDNHVPSAPPSYLQSLGHARFVATTQLTSLTWATSESRRHLHEFAMQCPPVATPSTVVAPPRASVDAAPAWGAAEGGAAAAVSRDVRALLARRAGPTAWAWPPPTRRLKPEAAAEMARARVAAAAAAAVMREEGYGATLTVAHQQTAPRFRRTSAAHVRKKRVAFAPDTIFKRA